MTLEQKETKFINDVYEVASKDYNEDLLENFCYYWCEPNRSGRKLRFEGQKFFDINRRLRTWARNQSNWNKAKNMDVKSETVTAKLKSYD